MGGTYAREFGGLFGETPPPFSIAGAPRVAAGEMKFERPGGETPFYELSPGIYSGLTGTQEFERRGAIETRTARKEELDIAREREKKIRELEL